MKYLFIFIVLCYACTPQCYRKDTITLFDNLYGCYECNKNERGNVVIIGKTQPCIYYILEQTLQKGPTLTTQKRYEYTVRDTYKLIKNNADSLIKKYNFKATEEEIVSIYLADQKAAYQIRSIEPMFQIDKAKTIPIIEDFLTKAKNNTNYARKDVVDYARKRLEFYLTQK